MPFRDLDERIAQATELLEAIVADHGILAHVPQVARARLLRAAGRAARPDRDARRRLSRVSRKKRKIDVRDADRRALDGAGIRAQRREAVFPTPLPASAADAPGRPGPVTVLREPRKCYICKSEFREVHFFYDAMCPPCAELNWRKRHQTADLSGRVALITGARVKIGYQAAIMLLRAGARVIVTTRFPRDAAARYMREPDVAAWRDRLTIHGLDLRHTPSVEALARHLAASLDRLDFILHNACQTVRRPPAFYAHLMDAELRPRASLPAAESALIAEPILPPGYALGDATGTAGGNSAALSQIALLKEDLARGGALFPAGCLDADLQQVDLRSTNSWRLKLADVPTVELLEVHLVNAVAPFVLSARLKPLMLRHRTMDKHIVNVSAMEGQFYRSFKTDRHPHTNMAKAALNMLTRTSAADYVTDGIHMNSVDTGWVTDEDPVELAARKTAEHGFHPPLDVVDGAARICDPIFSGMLTGVHVWGKFLKDYVPTDW